MGTRGNTLLRHCDSINDWTMYQITNVTVLVVRVIILCFGHKDVWGMGESTS